MSNKEEKERKHNKIEAIVDKVIARIVVIVVFAVIIIYIVPVMYTGCVTLFKEPTTYVLPIVEKDLEDTSTKSGMMSAPYLYFILDSGEEVKVKVNSASYENVQVGDLVAIDVWEVYKGHSVAQLNTELNNTVDEGK